MKKKILLSLLASSILVAQNIELEPLSVTSTAIKTDELGATDAVEIYTAEEIEKAHVQNVYEFLNQQTSVITMPSYGNPFTQRLDMRGYGIGDGYQNIVITIDGRKINNIDMVPPLLSAISPASIERLEIIKSSGIVVGGDGANAGAINITTKKKSAKEIAIYMGTHGTADGSFYLGHSDEKLSASASGEAQKSNGVRNINSGGDKDENSLTTGAFNLSYLPVEELELRVGASFARTDVLYTSSLTLEEYNNDIKKSTGTINEQLYDTDAFRAGFSYFINNNFSLDVDANHEEKTSSYETTGYKAVANYTYDSAKTTLRYEEGTFSFLSGFDIFDGKRESDATLYAIANEATKENIAGFIMNNYKFKSHSFKAGARVEKVKYSYDDTNNALKDEHSLFGTEIGYNYTFDKENSIFANYAHAYQAPDVDRFFNKDWLGTVSFNGFINPMKTDSFTLGYNNIKPKNKFKLSLFYVDLKDEIYLNPTTWANTNIDKSYKYGLDIYDKWLVTDAFNVALNYNYVRAIIDEEENYSSNNLPCVSDHNIKATLSYLPNKNTTLALTQVYRSEAYAADDFENSFVQKQDAYKSTDVSITYAKDSLELFAKINNLFNQKNGLWVQDDAIYPVNFTTTAIAGFRLKI